MGVVMNLGDYLVRFSPDGKVSVIDAIKAVSDSDRAGELWEDMVSQHPDLLSHCGDYNFQGEETETVIDTEGWERIRTLLPAYLGVPGA